MKGGRNLPKKTVFTAHRVKTRYVEPSSPTRSADEALLAFVLGRPATDPDPQPVPPEEDPCST